MNISHLIKRQVELNLPRTLVFGNKSSMCITDDIIPSEKKKAFIILEKAVTKRVKPIVENLEKEGVFTCLWTNIESEPTILMVEEALQKAQNFNPDIVVGIGGGSILDVAKVVAALTDGDQNIKDIIGTDKLNGRETYLVCLPTTAGTGSEVSPNAIVLDENENLKKGIISPLLVPDATCVDLEMAKTVPASVTAATGLDALTHCIEVYANRFAHPMVDLYALEGIKLIGANLGQAVKNGEDLEARTKMSLGSMYGGLCLGPVNTAAVHASSYPLGSEFHLAHGISNAILLPSVLEFNLKATPERYARIAEALGAQSYGEDDLEIAKRGVKRIRQLMKSCAVPEHLSAMGIPEDAIDYMAEAAMSVKRLLKNNPRELTREDAKAIYQAAY